MSLLVAPSLLGNCPVKQPLETEPDGMAFNKEQNAENYDNNEKNT